MLYIFLKIEVWSVQNLEKFIEKLEWGKIQAVHVVKKNSLKPWKELLSSYYTLSLKKKNPTGETHYCLKDFVGKRF